ncbi:MAG: fabD [Acidimicrobiales bacterium]|nr:fabD [Acidimicrobiales bacterium]
MSIAVAFPGQGAQAPGFGASWLEHPAWSVVIEAERATDLPLAHLLLDATPDELADTRASQLSVLVGSLVAWQAFRAELDEPVVAMTGHSLGQITALIASGAVDLEAGIRLAAARAEATATAQRERAGGMVALLGADEELAVRACDAAPGRAWVANLNGGGQVVVGGEVDALDDVADRALELGARRARRLAVGGAFHTPLMAPAARAIGPALDRTPFTAPSLPVVTNHDAEPVTSDAGWPDRLQTHLVSPVRWGEVVATLARLGARTVVEVGPGTTLTGLVRRIDPELAVAQVATPDDLPIGASR